MAVERDTRDVAAPLEWPDLDRETLFPASIFVLFFLGWEFLVPVLGIEPYILPTPSAIAVAFLESSDVILRQLRFTVVEFLVGFTLTVITGYLAALGMAYWRLFEVTFYPYVVVIRSIPVVTLLPIFIIWFGFGFNSIVIISYVISLFPMVVNSLSGFKSTDPERIDMIRSFSANKRQVFWNVYRYSSLPSVFAGLKICIILAFTGAIVGEFLIGSRGIGYLILSYNSNLETAKMFAAIMTVSTTELVIFGAVSRLEKLVVTWQ
ncbi:MAG: ABC transporter permease [Halanaeroarchaeum sp.]